MRINLTLRGASGRRSTPGIARALLGSALLLGALPTAPAGAAPPAPTGPTASPRWAAAADGVGASGDATALDEVLRFANVATTRCLDSNFAGNVYTLNCNGGPYQTWISPGDLRLVDLATNRCLDSNAVGNVYTLPCNGGDFQKWFPRNRNEVVNLATGRCLDSNFAGNVYTLDCNGGNFQKWNWSTS